MPQATKQFHKQVPPPEEKSPSSSGLPLIDALLRLFTHFERFAWDIAGVVLISLAVMVLLALSGLTSGALLLGLAGVLRKGLGWGSFLPALGAAVAGFWMLRRRAAGPASLRWGRILSLEFAAFVLVAVLTLAGGASLERAEQGLDGGVIGWGLVELLSILIQPGWLLLSILLALLLWLLLFGLGLQEKLARMAGAPARLAPAAEPVQTTLPEVPAGFQPPPARRSERPAKEITPLPSESKKLTQPLEPEKAGPPPARDERLPNLDLLLNEQANKPDERNINLTAGIIETTLAEFGIPAQVVGYRVGPTITQFAVEPGFVERPGPDGELARQKVRVSQISALNRDLSLALSASRLRIEAPVPGRPYVGIEVPNSKSSTVRLRPILETEAFYKFGSPLTIALGRDVSGQAVVADLARMPHLLIAGTTGSGKSICIAALTACLVMNNTPEDLRLVMIDPKMVELVRFNGLPHLFGKVETDLERILAVLRWTVSEMDRRYKLLELHRARNIATYNKKLRRKKGEEALPHIVVMIDELADLMMSAPDQTEHTIVRLAQMARAVGIHLVVATQRPSTDVVTGLIKANFPARISFAVASSIDSRVILDTTGAESLLGHGDMLFLPPEAASPVRAQGVFIADDEVQRVIDFWGEAHPKGEPEPAPWDEMIAQETVAADRDDLLFKAIIIVRDEQKVGASMLQRRLRIGYPRAARLIDELEELGVIGPATPGREREVLMSPDDDVEDYRPKPKGPRLEREEE